MKRELKHYRQGWLGNEYVTHCKAYPDEKGIETMASPSMSMERTRNCKAYPDEKGIETVARRRA